MNPTYKYAIKTILDDLPVKDRRATMHNLRVKLEIGRSRLYDIINAEIGSKVAMTTDQLIAAADVLGVEVDDLLHMPQPSAL